MVKATVMRASASSGANARYFASSSRNTAAMLRAIMLRSLALHLAHLATEQRDRLLDDWVALGVRFEHALRLGERGVARLRDRRRRLLLQLGRRLRDRQA